MSTINYLVLRVSTDTELAYALQAELAELGFDSFWEDGNAFETSILESDIDRPALDELLSRYAGFAPLEYDIQWVEKQNWNELWEQNYAPITIGRQCLIRADFHHIEDRESYACELIITPKMSFGTGHHETTSLMLTYQLETDHHGKKIADFGCGTGVLAIMGMKLGAVAADACDIEDWSVENTLENAEVNGVKVHAFEGTAADVPAGTLYDLILANINLNVLLQEMHLYAALLQNRGILLLSGFYQKDANQIRERAAACGLNFDSQKVKNEWTAMKLYRRTH